LISLEYNQGHLKVKMYTLEWHSVHILQEEICPVADALKNNRHIENEQIFFDPHITDLHDPYLMPDMEKSVQRILEALEKKERIVIFGDYDVDGVSSTAMLVRFLSEIGCEVSYRLPHRVHDGYGLKSYFFDELAEKNVKLVITVDCGTRDIEPIKHAKNLGIDVIITDHHAVPDLIPTEVIGIINPKRKDSLYPFPNLAGAGVAFKLVHAILIAISNKQWIMNKASMLKAQNGDGEKDENSEMGVRGEGTVWAEMKNSESMSEANSERVWLPLETFGTEGEFEWNEKRSSPGGFGYKSTENGVWEMYNTLTKYIDFASLWTVADCMPLIWENRTITTLGLQQMKNSESAGLKKFLEGNDRVEWNADIIGFQIWPRINASGRMDTPLTALRWLLASEERCDEFLSEIESLNQTRQEVVKSFSEKALEKANPDDGILFFHDKNLEHGLIWLVAGKLTEAYNRPSIVLCDGHNKERKKKEEVWNREYELLMRAQNGESEGGKLFESDESKWQMSGANEFLSPSGAFGTFQSWKVHDESTKNGVWKENETLVASCRSPEWCNLVELLDACKGFFVRYGGHRQAAGFTIERNKLEDFQKEITRIFHEKYGKKELPKKTIIVESILHPKDLTLASVDALSRFRPFGIGNPKPLWLLKDVTILSTQPLGQEGKHLSIYIAEKPEIKLILWNADKATSHLTPGNIISLIVELDENEWHGKKSVQVLVRNIVI